MTEKRLNTALNKVTQCLLELESAAQLKKGAKRLLTDKEVLIASYLLSDYTISQIAKQLCRSNNTIKMHIKNIKRKCRCETQARLGAVLQIFFKNTPSG